FTPDVVRAGLERSHERGLLVVTVRVDVDLAEPVELPRDGARRAQAAAVLAQRMPHFGHGTVRVVRHRLDVQSDSARAVAFVRDLLVVHALELARALLDGALD